MMNQDKADDVIPKTRSEVLDHQRISNLSAHGTVARPTERLDSKRVHGQVGQKFGVNSELLEDNMALWIAEFGIPNCQHKTRNQEPP